MNPHPSFLRSACGEPTWDQLGRNKIATEEAVAAPAYKNHQMLDSVTKMPEQNHKTVHPYEIARKQEVLL